MFRVACVPWVEPTGRVIVCGLTLAFTASLIAACPSCAVEIFSDAAAVLVKPFALQFILSVAPSVMPG